jgi:hypothetical protein
MNDTEKEIILKYFGNIVNSIEYHKTGQTYARNNLALSDAQDERGIGIVQGIVESKNRFIEMCQEFGIDTW